jgi:hypothetical protein
MTNRIRLLAGSITLAGAALLVSPSPAYSTMSRDVLDPLGTRFCCGSDLNGDGRADSFCCYSGGCTAGPRGCTQTRA